MVKNLIQWLYPRHFKTQLFLIFSIGVLMLATSISISTTWKTNNRVRDVLVNDGLKVTEVVAQQSVLALLYASTENANTIVNSALSSNSVTHVSLYDSTYKLLAEKGTNKQRAPEKGDYDTASRKAKLIRETDNNWYFIAPVYLKNTNFVNHDEFSQPTTTEKELLGFAYVVMEKLVLNKIYESVLLNNFFTAFFTAFVLILIANFTLKQFMRPLMNLMETMQRAKMGASEIYADATGPTEIKTIAKQFNSMMRSIEERDKQLRQNNIILEEKVAARTEELVRARDAALDANKHKSEFLANVTHELRTPLQSVIGYADVLIDAAEDDSVQGIVGDLEKILQNAEHLLGLINSILELTKMEMEHLPIKYDEVDLKQLLLQLENTVRPLIEANHNEFELIVNSEDEKLVIDRTQLLQVLINVVGNAAKFTHNGQVQVRVTHTKEKLEIRITDNGIGISQKEMDCIFEPFRQVDGSIVRKYGGTGLGLAISQKFCTIMGGSITVDSTLQRGSTFTIFIPLPVSLATFNAKESVKENIGHMPTAAKISPV